MSGSAPSPMNIVVWLTHPEVECWNFRERHAERLMESLGSARVNVRISGDEAEFLRVLPEAGVAIVWEFEEPWLEKAEKLEWIVTPAAGRDYFRLSPRPGLDIDYCSFHGEIMGETVLAFLLAHCRGVVDVLSLQRESAWPRRKLAGKMRPLRGSRLTVLGFGNIGRWIGRLAKPFGVQVTGVKRRPSEPPEYFGAGDRIVLAKELESVLPSTDFLVVCLPRGEATDRIVDRRRLDLLPPGAVVINVGRGNAVDEAALARKLESRELAGAYLDVYREEPLPEDSPLRSCPNALLMPHASAISPDYLDLFLDEFTRKFHHRFGYSPGSASDRA